MIDQTLAILIELQEVDREILQLRGERSGKPATLEAHRRELAEIQGRVEATKQEREGLRSRQRLLEGEIADKDAHVAKLTAQLNLVKTNKEFQAFQHEIEGEKANKRLVEEKELEILEQIEQTERELADLAKEIERREARLADEEREVAELVEQLDRELAGLDARRNEMARPVPPDALAFYDRLVTNFKGYALVAVEDRHCTGCYGEVPINVINNLHKAQDFVTCTSCRRILYLR